MNYPSKPKNYILLLVAAWTAVVVFSGVKNIYDMQQDQIEDAHIEARTYSELNLAYGKWAMEEGGIYTFSPGNAPHPFPGSQKRDITTVDGQNLQLINPAHMSSKVFQFISKTDRPIIGKVINLSSVDSGNDPDAFERKAIRAFAAGQKEFMEQVTIQGITYLRLARPFVTEQACLQCHGEQGYKKGDIKGGISVSVPVRSALGDEYVSAHGVVFSHFMVWLIVGAGMVGVSRKDFNQRRKIAENEWKFHTLADSASDWVYWMSEEKKIIFMTPSCKDITGFGADEFSDDSWPVSQIIYPEDKELWDKHIDNFMTGEHEEIEFRVVTKEGKVKWISHTCAPIYSQDRFLGRRSSNKDITSRKQAEEELRHSEARLKEAQSIAHLGNWELDLTDYRLVWSDEIYRIFEIDPEAFEASYEAFLAAIHPEDREMVNSYYVESVRNKAPYQVIHRLLMPDGRIKYVQERGLTYYDLNGNPTRSIGTIQDITEQKKAEEEINFLATTVKTIPDAVFSIDPTGKIVSWNKGGEKMLGYAASDIIGKPILALAPDETTKEEMINCISVLKKDGFVTGHQAQRLSKDGVAVPVEITAVALRENGNGRNITGYSTIMRDITERKAAAEKLQKQFNRLAALRSIDMAITASVDLRVTLSVVIDNVAAQLGADAASLLIRRNTSHLFEHAASKGFHTDAIKHSHVRIGQSYAGYVAHERRILSLPEIAADNWEIKDRPPFLEKEGFQAYFGAPLIAKGIVIGVLEVFLRRPFHPDEEWLDFLETLAGQAAIAMENASLFNELQGSNDELVMAYDSTLEGWSRALDYRDQETEGHSQRVTEMTANIARIIGVREKELVHVRRGALLHDIGKLGIPDNVLLKPGSLTAEEWVLMKMHPQIAYDLIYPIAFLRPAVEIPYCHHEKWNGSGYPRGLKGENIPFAARIFTIIDVWDALSSNRPYRPAWAEEKIRDHIRNLAGSEFDPQMVELILKHIDEIKSSIVTKQMSPGLRQ